MTDSSFSRLIGVLVKPTETFKAIVQRPTWLVALLLLVILGTVAGLMVFEKMDMDEVVRERIEARGRQVSAEQIEQRVEVAEKFGWIGALVGTLVIGPAVYLITALVFWVLFKLLGGEFSFKTGFSVTLHGFMPGALSSLLALPVIWSRESIDIESAEGGFLASNLGFLAPEEASRAVKTLLGGIDLFSIWTVILLTIGFSIAAKVSRRTSAITVVVLWALYVLGKAGWAALTS